MATGKTLEELIVRIRADTKQLQASLGKVKGDLGKVEGQAGNTGAAGGAAMGKIKKGAVVAAAAVLGISAAMKKVAGAGMVFEDLKIL